MKMNRIWLALLITATTLSGFSSQAGAAESKLAAVKPVKMHLTALPLQYGFVHGDEEKFQAVQWMAEDYIGGIEDFSLLAGDVEELAIEMDGHALAGNGDYEANVVVTKEGVGELRFFFDQFRKYYDDQGGVYHPFPTLSGLDLDRELSIDIGKFGIELILHPEDWPELGLAYEHEYKKGAKNSLAWADARQVTGGLQRKIAPAWMEVDEEVNIFKIHLDHEIKGYHMRSETKWEMTDVDSRRYERYLATTTSATDRKVRIQDKELEADLFQTSLFLEKWFAKDKAYSSAYYRFMHLTNDEIENLREFNEFLLPTNFANAEQKINAIAENKLDSHAWAWNVAYFPWSWVNVIGKLKAETISRGGNSSYPSDNLPGSPDGLIDHTEMSRSEESRRKIGEGISIRFKGIPRSALYTELQFEQIEDFLNEQRTSIGPVPSGGEIFERETGTSTLRGEWTLGGSFQPVRILTLTSQVRYVRSNSDYDTLRETVQGATAFIDSIDIQRAEYNARATLRPYHWLQTSFRYTVSDTDYFTQTQGDINEVENGSLANTYVFDVTVIPLPEVFVTTSYTHNNSATKTKGEAIAGVAYMPTFNSDYNTWMFNVNYVPCPKWSMNTNFHYTKAANYNDFTAAGMPYGAAFDQLGLVLDMKWHVREDFSVEPYYGFYYYSAEPRAENNEYHAHVVGFKTSYTWG